jgi:mannose-6-phosphate isomerase-like protein (cupin superfamily)
MRITPSEALVALQSAEAEFTLLFRHGTLEVEFYKPDRVDRQQPHSRDEVYVVFTGTGHFFCGGIRMPFGPGDFLFVPAGVEHRFEEFSEDFTTWVLFYGPEGGEVSTT